MKIEIGLYILNPLKRKLIRESWATKTDHFVATCDVFFLFKEDSIADYFSDFLFKNVKGFLKQLIIFVNCFSNQTKIAAWLKPGGLIWLLQQNMIFWTKAW